MTVGMVDDGASASTHQSSCGLSGAGDLLAACDSCEAPYLPGLRKVHKVPFIFEQGGFLLDCFAMAVVC